MLNDTVIAIAAFASVVGATPTFAQQSEPSAGGAAYQQVQSEFAAAYNRKDVSAMAALFSENGIRITPSGIARGRDAIRRQLQGAIDLGLHDYSVHRTLSRATGDGVFNAGEWSAKLGATSYHGYYSALLGNEHGEVKILEETVNVAAP